MWAMRCVYGALCCYAWELFVVYAVGLDSTSSIIRSTFHLAVIGGVVLPPTAGVIAIFDRDLPRWTRVAAITFGVIIPAAGILLFLAFLAGLDQLN